MFFFFSLFLYALFPGVVVGKFQYWDFNRGRAVGSLRGPEVSIEGVSQNGVFQVVYYGEAECKSPEQKAIVALNTCAPTWKYADGYAKVAVQANSQMNTYSVQLNYYTDSSCTALQQTDAKTENILICNPTSDGTYLTHTRSEPLYFQYDNLDYTIELYDTATNCQANGFTGLLDVQYVKFGVCAGWNGFDMMISSCTSDGLQGFTYTSQDFTCSGTPTAFTLASSSTCTSSDANIVSLFQGYANFVCSPGH